MIEYLLILTFVLSAISIFYARRLVRRRRANPSGLPYPPGSRGLPVLGNLFDINMSKPWLTYTAWGKKYGDIVYLTLLGQDYIVINSVKVARTLLEQRSSNYSDRLTPTLYKHFGVDFLTVFSGYTEQWKVHRKLFNLTLRTEIIIKHRNLYMRKAHELALKLVNDSEGPPMNLEEYFIRFSGSVIMAVAYGYEVTSHDDPLVARARKLTNIIMDDAPAERAVLLTAFPLLRYLFAWFPGMAFQRQVSFCRELAAEVRDVPFNYVKNQRAAGKASYSMAFDFFEHYSEDGIDEEMELTMRDTAATNLLVGGKLALLPKVVSQRGCKRVRIALPRPPLHRSLQSTPDQNNSTAQVTMIEYPLILTFVLSVISVFFARRLEQRRANPSGLPYPPGPRGLPVLGNLFGINLSKPWLTYSALGKKYGDIVYLTLLGQDYIVINSVKVARTLLEQRSSNYSDRLTPTLYKQPVAFLQSVLESVLTPISPGATVVYNVWEMSRAAANDPDDAACFNPNRYLTPDGKLSPEDAFTNSPSFGSFFSAGRFFAEGSIWAAVVTMLATLSFTKAQDLNGTEIDVNPEFTGVMVSYVATYLGGISEV
ncbi:cytochrome P450 [Hygrophoropsis aurantiaca]|uniref:Cytochrome P450 n=1 Tax=Hygrophoropsis aurantiaca TaxID=72124 RepID=A0ACB7ZT46_9AGAM|nr:cytochrome P450 [Hygrophoropsis aurantiaca]